MGTTRADSAEQRSGEAFHLFYDRVEPMLRKALIAAYSTDRGL